MRQSLHFALLGAFIGLVYLSGGLSFVERYLLDARFGLGSRAASGEVVIVAIDSDSLRWLEVWPWPRRYYADVIETLLEADVERIAIDVDFSSFSRPEDDRRLAEALAAAGPERVALPVFRQIHPAPDGTLEVTDTAPNALFAPHVSEVHADFQPDPDGLVRRIEGHHERRGRWLPAMSLWLSGKSSPPADTEHLDFAIDAASIQRLSFVDVLEGTFDPSVVAGRRIIIGATANELGDQASVPRYRILPGAVVHALAYETLRQDRALQTLDGWPIALLALALGMVSGPWFMRLGAWRSLALATGLGIALLAMAAALQPIAAVVFEITPLLLNVIGSFGVALTKLLHRKDTLIREVVDNCFDAIVTFDAAGTILSFNQSAARLFNYLPTQAIGMRLDELLGTAEGAPLSLTSSGTKEVAARHRSGRFFPAEAAISAMRLDGQWVGIIAIRDITERKAQEAALRRMAMHDPLTGLANRALLHDRLAQAIARARRTQTRVALLLLDLDRFKEVNDTLGHQAGDVLLQHIGPRLARVLRESDTLARLGGDEFALVLPEVKQQAACAIAERIVDLFRRPFRFATCELELGVSIGIALYPEHGERPADLLQRADVAMYNAKRNQTGFETYCPDEDRHSLRRLTLQTELRRSIEEDTLEVYYQPKVATETLGLIGVEALVRWRHDEHGFVPTEEFVKVAEQTGLIRPLTTWVLKVVLRQQRTWREQGLDLLVAVNLSVRLLQERDYPARFRALVEELGGDPTRLQLEITESALMADPALSMAALARLAAMGCRLSLDDFGTGYSSLGYLQKLPIHELKIDRCFVFAMNQDSSATVIVRSVINLAHSLDLAVVAEGVENRAIYDRLRALRCDAIQGYFIGRPMPIGEFETWLARTSTRRTQMNSVLEL